ncbi:MAG: hypothetical protein U1E92_03730 [Moraxella osloensis]
MVQDEKGYVIMSASGTEAVLTILTKPNAKLGLVFLDMTRLKPYQNLSKTYQQFNCVSQSPVFCT